MSFCLHFWNQSSCCTLDPPEVLEQLAEGNVLPGIEPIPFDRICDRLVEEFPSIENFGSPSFTWESGDECFLMYIGKYHIEVESHGATTDTLNRVIDLAIEFDCRLYDPQTGVRYEG